MGRLTRTVLAGLVVALSACSSDDATTPDATTPGDGGQDAAPDAQIVYDKCDTRILGQPCTPGERQCGGANFCLETESGTGVCTCDCTPDNPDTEDNDEDSCPDRDRHVCGSFIEDGVINRYCFRTCSPRIGGNECEGKLACLPEAGHLTAVYHTSVCAFAGCEIDADCPVVTAKSCDTEMGGCSPDERCIAVNDVVTAGHCAKPGKCDAASGLCDLKPASLSKAARVGDPCNGDTDCDRTMRCMMEYDAAEHEKPAGEPCTVDEDCCSNKCESGKCTAGVCTIKYRNGYCYIPGCTHAASLTIRSCPDGSTCNNMWLGGICQKTCGVTVEGDCRGVAEDKLGDYECRALYNLKLRDLKVSEGPVCDFGPAMPCTLLKQVECSFIGYEENPSNMQCRSLSNEVLTDPHDPMGFCLDDTASGGLPGG